MNSLTKKVFFYTLLKNLSESCENVIEMERNNGYRTGKLLDYEYFSNNYKLTVIDLSKQIELENPNLKQKINFVGRLDEDNATMFLIFEK